jgi:DNA-binding IclR family transcriptional regulator
MSENTNNAVNEGMLQRIYSEFLEMPGLRLTCEQAQRLWGLDAWTCRELLESLVEAEFLYRGAHGGYARLTDGFAKLPLMRMARTHLNTTAKTVKKAV